MVTRLQIRLRHFAHQENYQRDDCDDDEHAECHARLEDTLGQLAPGQRNARQQDKKQARKRGKKHLNLQPAFNATRLPLYACATVSSICRSLPAVGESDRPARMMTLMRRVSASPRIRS